MGMRTPLKLLAMTGLPRDIASNCTNPKASNELVLGNTRTSMLLKKSKFHYQLLLDLMMDQQLLIVLYLLMLVVSQPLGHWQDL